MLPMSEARAAPAREAPRTHSDSGSLVVQPCQHAKTCFSKRKMAAWGCGGIELAPGDGGFGQHKTVEEPVLQQMLLLTGITRCHRPPSVVTSTHDQGQQSLSNDSNAQCADSNNYLEHKTVGDLVLQRMLLVIGIRAAPAHQA